MNIPSLALIAFRRQARERRKALGLSQKELAVRIDDAGVKLSAKDINDIETQARGVSLDEALAIAEALLVQLDDLLTDPSVERMGASIEAAGALARSVGRRFAKHDQASEATGEPSEPGTPQTRTLTAQELHFKRTPRGKHLIGPRFSESDVPSTVSDSELGEFNDGVRLCIKLPVQRVHNSEQLTETRIELRGSRVTVRSFEDGHAVQSCTFEGVDSLVLRFDELPEGVSESGLVFHEISLAGHGADRTAPATSADAGTSADEDTVRDATDTSSPPTAGRAE